MGTEYMTPTEVAEALRCGRRVVYGLVAAGQLRAVRIGTGPRPRLRIPSTALHELARRSENPARAPRTGSEPAVEARAHGGADRKEHE